MEGEATGFTVTGTTVTLTDDDTASTAITLAVDPISVAEDSTGVTVTVTATLNATARTVDTEVTVQVGATGDSATKGEDYAEVSSFTLEIPANTLTGTGTFELTPTQDVVAEGPETLSVTGEAEGFAVTPAEVTLTDDDVAPSAITLTVSPDEVAENAAATTVTVTARLEGSVTLADVLDVRVQVGATGDSAAEGTDYESVAAFTLEIAANELQGTATFELTPTQDNNAEGAETLSVEGTSSGFMVTGTEVTLTDDDTAPTQITLAVEPEKVSEGAGAATVTVTATLSGSVTLPSATTVTVQVGKSGDSATEDEDYAAVGDVTVTIPADTLQGTGTFELTPKQDNNAEGAETLSVEGTSSGFMVTGTVVMLTDDDTAPTQITLAVEPEKVSEGAGATTVTVTATLSGSVTLPSATTVTVQVGKSGDSAVEAADYGTVSDFTLTIPRGVLEGTAMFTLTPMQDTVSEGAETLSVEGTSSGFTVTGTEVTLRDDDTASSTITLAVSPEEVSEGAGATRVTVTATLSGNVMLPGVTTVTVQVGKSGDSAVEGEDYESVTAFTLEIPANALQGTGTFELTPTPDAVAEGDEKVSVEGTAPGFTVAPAELTLTDDDTASTAITLAVSPEEVSEGAGATRVTVTATLGGSVTLPGATTVTVQVGAPGDSAAEGEDYAGVGAVTITIPAEMPSATGTFTLTPTPDTIAEGSETISVEGEAPGFTVTGTEVTLRDDDTASSTITLAVSPEEVSEGAGATRVTVTATLSGSVTLPGATTVTVQVGKSDDSAVEGEDYGTVSDVHTGRSRRTQLQGTATFELTPTQDTVAEGTGDGVGGGRGDGVHGGTDRVDADRRRPGRPTADHAGGGAGGGVVRVIRCHDG